MKGEKNMSTTVIIVIAVVAVVAIAVGIFIKKRK